MSTDFDKGPDLRDGYEGNPDHAVLARCLDLIERDAGDPHVITRTAVEFGVGSGTTLRMIAGVMPVIGFDSFEGLPEDWRPSHRKGHFALDPKKRPLDIPGATIVPGWFNDTVPDYDFDGLHIALIHFDADLYSSTTLALYGTEPAGRPGCILVFDEFFGYDDDFKGTVPGERQAFWEYVEASGMKYDVIGHGREQWAVRVR